MPSDKAGPDLSRSLQADLDVEEDFHVPPLFQLASPVDEARLKDAAEDVLMLPETSRSVSYQAAQTEGLTISTAWEGNFPSEPDSCMTRIHSNSATVSIHMESAASAMTAASQCEKLSGHPYITLLQHSCCCSASLRDHGPFGTKFTFVNCKLLGVSCMRGKRKDKPKRIMDKMSALKAKDMLAELILDLAG